MSNNSKNPTYYFLCAFIAACLVLGFAVYWFVSSNPFNSKESQNITFSQIANDNYSNFFTELGVSKIESSKDNLGSRTFKIYDKNNQKICLAFNQNMDYSSVDPFFPPSLDFKLGVSKTSHKIAVYIQPDTTALTKDDAVRSFYGFMETIAYDCLREHINHLSWSKEPLNLDRLFNARFGQLLDTMKVATIESSGEIITKKPGDDGFRIFTAKDIEGNTVGKFNNIISKNASGFIKTKGEWHVVLKDDKNKTSPKEIGDILLDVSLLFRNSKVYDASGRRAANLAYSYDVNM